MRQYNQLLFGQIVCFTIAGLFAVLSLRDGFYSAVPSLIACTILAVIGWIGPQIVHELAEINDQLAGRSKEFQGFFNDLKKRT